jgi:hypothetical protein
LVTKSRPLFDPAGVNQAKFDNFPIRELFQTSIQILTLGSQHYTDFCTIFDAASKTAWVKIGGELPANPTPTPAAGDNMFTLAHITALVNGIQAGAKAPTLTGTKQISYATTINARYAIAFAKTVPHVDVLIPPTVTPATLHPDFICILKTTKNTTVQRDITDIIDIKMNGANQSNDHLDLIATFEPITINTVFTATLKNFSREHVLESRSHISQD